MIIQRCCSQRILSIGSSQPRLLPLLLLQPPQQQQHRGCAILAKPSLQCLLSKKRQHYSHTARAKINTVKTPILISMMSTTIEPTTSEDDTSKVKTVPITFVEADGKEKTVPAELGKNLLDVAHDHHVDLEGACGGELSCSTCHLIFETDIYEKLPPKLDDEQDMLDLAFAVTETYV
jgi:ferredoxin-2, mitochondrial